MSARTSDTTLVAVLSVLLIAGLWAHLFVSLAPSRTMKLSDFAGYYGAAQVILADQPERLYDDSRKVYTNLPIVSLALAPLALLPYPEAWDVFWWLQVGSFVAAFVLLLWGIHLHFPPLTPSRVAWASVVFVCFGPLLRRCLDQGQTTPMMLLLMVAMWMLCRARWNFVAGLVLGIICTVKIPPMVIAGVFVLRRRLVLGLTAAAVVVAAVVASWLVFGPEILGQYADRIIWNNAGGSYAAFNNRSLEGALLRTFTDRSIVDWTPHPRPGVVTAGLVATIAVLSWLLLRHGGYRLLWPTGAHRDEDPREGSLELELALGAALMVLFFPIVWIHYYLFLAVPLALLPLWWVRGEYPRKVWSVGLLLVGGWLASGLEVPGNIEAGELQGQTVFVLKQNLQPLGALLLVAGLSAPIGELAKRRRSDPGESAANR